MGCHYIKWRKSDFENGAPQAKPIMLSQGRIYPRSRI
jgi:hypothetical protein